jgi:hypothetical protein
LPYGHQFVVALSQKGDVEIIKDPRIDALIKQEGAIIPPATSPQMVGYRIQLFFDSNKSAVDEARSKIHERVPQSRYVCNLYRP